MTDIENLYPPVTRGLAMPDARETNLDLLGDKCVELDKKIERHERIAAAIACSGGSRAGRARG